MRVTPSIRAIYLSYLVSPDSFQEGRADLGVSPGPTLSISGMPWKSPNRINVAVVSSFVAWG